MKRLQVWAVIGSLFILGVFAAHGCSSSDKKNPVNPGPVADVTITIIANNGNMSFSPNPANVTAGQKVAWKNNTTNGPHTATENGGTPIFNTGNIANGSTSAAITISTTGDLSYRCLNHPTMVGTLHVTP